MQNAKCKKCKAPARSSKKQSKKQCKMQNAKLQLAPAKRKAKSNTKCKSWAPRGTKQSKKPSKKQCKMQNVKCKMQILSPPGNEAKQKAMQNAKCKSWAPPRAAQRRIIPSPQRSSQAKSTAKCKTQNAKAEPPGRGTEKNHPLATEFHPLISRTHERNETISRLGQPQGLRPPNLRYNIMTDYMMFIT